MCCHFCGQVCEIVSTSPSLSIKDTHSMEGIMAYSDSGLPGILFSLLDQEEDSQVMQYPHHLASDFLSHEFPFNIYRTFSSTGTSMYVMLTYVFLFAMVSL
jgi:hypothetical protein